MVWTIYIYKHLKFSSIFRIWTITMPQRDCKNWTCNHQTGCLCNYCWATCHLVGKYLLVLNIFIQTSLDWMQLGHHPSQQQGQITSPITAHFTSPVSSPTPQPLIKKNVARGEGGSNPRPWAREPGASPLRYLLVCAHLKVLYKLIFVL